MNLLNSFRKQFWFVYSIIVIISIIFNTKKSCNLLSRLLNIVNHLITPIVYLGFLAPYEDLHWIFPLILVVWVLLIVNGNWCILTLIVNGICGKSKKKSYLGEFRKYRIYIIPIILLIIILRINKNILYP